MYFKIERIIIKIDFDKKIKTCHRVTDTCYVFLIIMHKILTIVKKRVFFLYINNVNGIFI